MDFPDLEAAVREPDKRDASAAELEKRALRAALLKYTGEHVQPFRRRRLPAQTPRSCSSARSMVALPEPSLGAGSTAALRAPAPLRPTTALPCPALPIAVAEGVASAVVLVEPLSFEAIRRTEGVEPERFLR